MWHQRRGKYNNRKIKNDGYIFDSCKEADYYEELKILLKQGILLKFSVKPKEILQEGFIDQEGNKIREIIYIPDFILYYNNLTEFIDVKGIETTDFKLKWKMLKYKYRNDKHYKFTIIK